MATSSYAELQTKLAAVITQLEAEDVDIDQAIELHKQATALIARLEQHLDRAKLTITELTADEES